MSHLTTGAIIVAAGRGSRAGGDIPKQYQLLNGKTVLGRSITALADHPEISTVVVVIHPDDQHLFDPLATDHPHVDLQSCFGGAERSQSVERGLAALKGNVDKVLIHDGARPLLSAAIISDVIAHISPGQGAAPALALSDSLWSSDDQNVQKIVPRQGLYRAQTPQGFLLTDIFRAYEGENGQHTDDVSVALAASLDVTILTGDERNLKITTAQDFARAEQFLRPNMDIRTGTGFDVHAFDKGNHVTLCGIEIPFHAALSGHSDADVAMHAITDAIYGALAQGDIGRWFPPNDDQWKGAASRIFLEHAVKLAADKGFRISNLDCTIICEQPKIGPHADAMRACLAEITAITMDRISVKATTSEQLGFTGRGEGIAAQASATLISEGS